MELLFVMFFSSFGRNKAYCCQLNMKATHGLLEVPNFMFNVYPQFS